jgi:peptidoglycan/LPS O-acetylase OafA/YrhL
MRKLHLGMGLVAVAVFLATGLYMKTLFPELYGSNESIRYQFRANHVYILMAALINLVVARNARPEYSGWRIPVSWLAALTLLLAPAVLVAAFFIEPVHGAANRPLTLYGVVALAAGVFLLYLPGLPRLLRRRQW